MKKFTSKFFSKIGNEELDVGLENKVRNKLPGLLSNLPEESRGGSRRERICGAEDP